jgi:DNA ligase-1
MGTPTKRRKLNHDAKPPVARNLDFFFGKQKQDKQETTPQSAASSSRSTHDNDEAINLTDEELARKLQAEWDQEANANDGIKEEGSSREYSADRDSNGRQSGPARFPFRTVDTDGAKVDINGAGNTGEMQHLEKPGVEHAVKPSGKKNLLSLQSAGAAEDTVSSTIPFDESPLTFDPSKYIEDLKGHWAAEGGDASYALLTRCFILVNSTQSRIKIVDTLVNLLRVIIEGDPSSLLPTVCLTLLISSVPR